MNANEPAGQPIVRTSTNEIVMHPFPTREEAQHQRILLVALMTLLILIAVIYRWRKARARHYKH